MKAEDTEDTVRDPEEMALPVILLTYIWDVAIPNPCWDTTYPDALHGFYSVPHTSN
jgi:hypothetical protein